MSGSFLPYHLRQNKAIDRNLFIELLSMINRKFPIHTYEYISMGGPFLEDFKIIHASTGIKKMTSIERNPEVIKRQKFNLPLSCIDLYEGEVSDFINSYNFPKRTVVWLDFTGTLDKCLSTIFEVVAKLSRGDVLKVTVNARLNLKVERPGDPDESEQQLIKLREKLGDYLPSDATNEMLSKREYPNLLYRMVDLVVDRAMGATATTYFQPLTSYFYADGSPMLTYSAIVLNRDERNEFFATTHINKWKLSVIGTNEPLPIQVPVLSIKERLLLDSLLPTSKAPTLQKKLKYLIQDNSEYSLEGISNYCLYYKQFPYFSKITP